MMPWPPAPPLSIHPTTHPPGDLPSFRSFFDSFLLLFFFLSFVLCFFLSSFFSFSAPLSATAPPGVAEESCYGFAPSNTCTGPDKNPYRLSPTLLPCTRAEQMGPEAGAQALLHHQGWSQLIVFQPCYRVWRGLPGSRFGSTRTQAAAAAARGVKSFAAMRFSVSKRLRPPGSGCATSSAELARGIVAALCSTVFLITNEE